MINAILKSYGGWDELDVNCSVYYKPVLNEEYAKVLNPDNDEFGAVMINTETGEVTMQVFNDWGNLEKETTFKIKHIEFEKE